jgi:acetyltransferase-like isoleucine patch superfamily enzyme
MYYMKSMTEGMLDIVGPVENLVIDETVKTVAWHYKLHINTSSGMVIIGKETFFGAGVMLLAGSHDYNLTGRERKDFWYKEGFDITIGDGVWIGSGAIIIGPCKIGDNAVIGAGSVVTHNVGDYEIWAGNPAVFIKRII